MPVLTDKARATRERILEAAEHQFHRHGYHATGLDRIIADAGVTKGNFYYHFKSKEALAVASLQRHFDRFGAELASRFGPDMSPLETVRGILDYFVELVTAQKLDGGVVGCYFGNFSLEMGAGHAAVRDRLQTVFATVRGRFEYLLQRAADSGDLPLGRDPKQIAAIIVSLLEGSILIDKASQEPREVARAVEFLKGYLDGG
ncbi:MAG: TetR/AcrR family transcriptional regulator [Gammaproteobacteria bacterium]|nr:TetR/AcrR family transcriptional regulator [Gammaproteobacteria bacterium]